MDYDWLIIGSGFGGSVSALRLSEKGYKVGVIEAGRRFEDEDFAKSSWQLNRYLWAPFLGLRGIMRFTPFKDIFIASGAGVGGGSIVYANSLYRAKSEFFKNPQWAGNVKRYQLTGDPSSRMRQPNACSALTRSRLRVPETNYCRTTRPASVPKPRFVARRSLCTSANRARKSPIHFSTERGQHAQVVFAAVPA